MTNIAPVAIHLRDLERDEIETLQAVIERRCSQLAQEFHEVGRFEVNVFGQGTGFEAHGHVRGRRTDFGTHARADEARSATDLALDRLEQQLRRAHDKRIFQQRREAQLHPPKREIGH